ncbi:MAG: hypothetical protein AB8B97_05615 [Granulosicoccus sp.]
MKGIRRGRKRKTVQATPVVADQIKQMVDLIDLKSHQGRRDRALLLLGFAAALRRSELVALDIADLEFVDQGLLVTVNGSKTDQEQVGAVVPTLAESGSPYFPVEAIRSWLINSGLREGPAFRSLYLGNTISDDWLSDKVVVLFIKSLACSTTIILAGGRSTEQQTDARGSAASEFAHPYPPGLGAQRSGHAGTTPGASGQ